MNNEQPLTVEPGICACSRRVVRGGPTSSGQPLVTADVVAVDAATELHAHTVGRNSYVLGYRDRRLTLRPRTADDIRRHPAGFKDERIVLAHHCTLSNERHP